MENHRRRYREAKALLSEHFRGKGVTGRPHVYLDNETYHFGNQHKQGSGTETVRDGQQKRTPRTSTDTHHMIRSVFPGAKIIIANLGQPLSRQQQTHEAIFVG